MSIVYKSDNHSSAQHWPGLGLKHVVERIIGDKKILYNCFNKKLNVEGCVEGIKKRHKMILLRIQN